MSDPDVFDACLAIGAAFGFFHLVLYALSSKGETAGFHLRPKTRCDWVGYWFRVLELILGATIYLGRVQVAPPFVSAVFILSCVLLFGSSVAFWRSDRGMSEGGLLALVVALAGRFFFFPVMRY